VAGLKVLNFLTFFDEGDDVGAGSKDYASQLAAGTGFNQNLAQITRKFALLFSTVAGALTDVLNANIIGATQIANDAVTKDKVDATVAGSGLKQNADGSLSPNVDGTTITVNASNQLQGVAVAGSYLIYADDALSSNGFSDVGGVLDYGRIAPTAYEYCQSDLARPKIGTTFLFTPGIHNLVLTCNLRAEWAGGTATVSLTVYDTYNNVQVASGVLSTTTIGYASYPDKTLTVPLTNLVSGKAYRIAIVLYGTSTTNCAFMQNVSITATP